MYERNKIRFGAGWWTIFKCILLKIVLFSVDRNRCCDTVRIFFTEISICFDWDTGDRDWHIEMGNYCSSGQNKKDKDNLSQKSEE